MLSLSIFRKLSLTLLSTIVVHGASIPTTTSSASSPHVTIYPSSTLGKPVTINGLSFPQFGQDVYLGIPFAEPPVGDLRFTPPQPKRYNSTTINAVKQPPACLQDPTQPDVQVFGQSEDCLYLNVYTPQPKYAGNGSLPVMLWVYGGAYRFGAASTYNATAIMGQGILTGKPIIYVQLNFRLGIFGFGNGAEFAANNAANLGLKDVRASLEWVRDNIWAFGGDPKKVTVFGQSAGAFLLSQLYLDPSINLFRSAIFESGSQSAAPTGRTATTYQGAYDATVRFSNCSTEAGGNQSSFECLKTLPAAKLLNASLEAINLMSQFATSYAFAPSVDGGIISDSPHTLLSQGKFAKIPFITGDNLDEATVFIPTTINSTAAVSAFLEAFEPSTINGTVLDRLLELYPDDPSLGSPYNTGTDTFGLSSQYKRLCAVYGDIRYQANRRWFLQQANKYGLTKTWSYLFLAPTPNSAPSLGIYHSSELPYIYGSATIAANYSKADVALSQQMIDYWLNFAYYTDPSGGGSNATYWPEYGSDQTLLQLNSTNTTLIPDTYRREQTDFILSQARSLSLR